MDIRSENGRLPRPAGKWDEVALSENEQHLQAVEALIDGVGEDSTREGLLKTPGRFLRAFEKFTSGYQMSVKEVINDAVFSLPEIGQTEMVLVRNIEFYSLCEHHLVPFFGKCHVGYLPRGKVIGLSKVARLVEVFSRRLQIQERLTAEIAQCMMKELDALGVGVVMEASHMCMMMRGVEKQGASTKTSKLLGEFQKHPTRTEFFNLIRD